MLVNAQAGALRAPYIRLFLISFLILFFELAAIRWFAATVVFLTFFTNIVLLACFLGMSVGLLAARRPQNFVAAALPLAMLTFALAIATHLAYWQWADDLTIALGGQQDSPRFVYFENVATFPYAVTNDANIADNLLELLRHRPLPPLIIQ